MNEIRFWHRPTQSLRNELVFGEAPLRWFHQHPVGKFLVREIFSKRLPSILYGRLQDHPTSVKKIPEFIEKYQIDMSEYEEGPFQSFNEFFIRRFKEGKRPFVATPTALAAPAEARYLAFASIDQSTKFPIKGMSLNVDQTLQFDELAHRFHGGPAVIARLCPTDYHRFHFPDDGRVLKSVRAGTRLFSVSPYALQMKGDILESNERQITFLETKNFGLIAYVEVGALFVGKIVQTSKSTVFSRGDEKGYFLFGASTVLMFGEKGKWLPDADLLEKTANGIESWCPIGSQIGRQIGS